MNFLEKYRPKRIADLVGQTSAAETLSDFAAEPYPAAFLMAGATGTGKTSAAHALAGEIGCNLLQAEFGGAYEIASGEQTADSVRKALAMMHTRPFFGSGWKVLIVNECDRMGAAVETIWLDALEHLPPKTVVVFTTNDASKLADRFIDRCQRIDFKSDAADLKPAARELAEKIWRAETGQDSMPTNLPFPSVIQGGQISFRLLVQALAPLCRTAIANKPLPRIITKQNTQPVEAGADGQWWKQPMRATA